MPKSQSKYVRLALIHGNCLFPDHDMLVQDDNTLLFMAEDYGLCSQFKYHKHKLVLILSAMRSHRDKLAAKHNIEYMELSKSNKDLSYEEKLLDICEKYSIKEIICYEIENHSFRDRMEKFSSDQEIKLNQVDSPGFLTTKAEFENYRDGYDRLFMNDFYIWQRKRLEILITEDGGPKNGKWSFDAENRKKLPKHIKVPDFPGAASTEHTREVSKLVDKLFPDNLGNTNNFYLPTTREQAIEWMDEFFSKRFSNFGPYEDAISKNEGLIFHSLLSPLINIGLLQPKEVVKRALVFAENNEFPFQSLEGFIRQIIGWREFVRGVYNAEKLRGNFFGHKRRLIDKWYKGTTGLDPLDCVIKRVTKYGYAHHIERLMVLSNIMLLTEIYPDDVYGWFMEMFVDSSEWVMVPNVYGMGQFADGGTFATKPYISGSNYILKMSNFKKGEWCDIWDGLYWRFIDKHRDYFMNNHRMSMMINILDKMDKKRRKNILKLAQKFIIEVSS